MARSRGHESDAAARVGLEFCVDFSKRRSMTAGGTSARTPRPARPSWLAFLRVARGFGVGASALQSRRHRISAPHHATDGTRRSP